MLFTSYSFLAFLLILFLLYYIVPKKCQWVLLLIAGYVFYAHAGWECFLFIGVTTITTYGVGLLIDRNHNQQKAYLAENKASLSKEEKKAKKLAKKKGVETSAKAQKEAAIRLAGLWSDRRQSAIDEAFGMWKEHDNSLSVEETVRDLRKGRKFDI